MTGRIASLLEQLLDFSNILNVSIAASWMVLAVIVLRFILKKAPKWTHVVLWGLVAVRLLLPFSIESVFSLIPSTETIPLDIEMAAAPAIDSGIDAINSVINPVISSSFTPNLSDSANPLQILIPLALVIWIAGIAIMMLYAIISYWRLRRRIDTSVLLKDNIFQSENISSPFVLGIIRPRIYMPLKMNERDMKQIVAHEQAHIRNRDHWWKSLGFLLLTIHWFNPLIWIAYILLCRDIELACDEKVIKDLDSRQRADYTQVLVSCSVKHRMIAACPLAFGEVGVKDRVKSVMNYKKPAFWIIVLAVVSCVVVTVCFLTNPIIFKFDESRHSIISASSFDVRSNANAGATKLSPAQLSELSTKLSGLKNTKISDEFGGFTPGYQISVLLQDGKYIRISGYSLSETDMVDIEWNGRRYVVTDRDFHAYLSQICSSADNVAAETQNTVGSPTLSLNDVIILSQKGHDLNWSDFEEYNYIETGFGLYIRVYEINELFKLWIGGGSLNSDPMYIYLALADDIDTRIDIRDEDVTEFISRHSSGSEETWDLIPMVMVNGTLYLDTGYESTMNKRCGVMDGEITSQVDGSKKPTTDNQSNFGTGYSYQYGAAEGTIELHINGKWWIFATEEARQKIQFGTEPDTTVIDYPAHKSLYEPTPTEQIEEKNGSEEYVITKLHYENLDGEWVCEGYTYKYRLEITGKLHNTTKNMTYIVLSNTKDISFEQTLKASGLSSILSDYFDPSVAVIVGNKLFS